MRPRQTHYIGGGRAVTRVCTGDVMIVPAADMSLGLWIMLEGSWEPGLTRVFRDTVRRGMTVVDVGANLGWYTLLAAREVGPRGHVHAFEPDPQLAEMLRDNIELNGYGERVTVHQCALADAAGRATFHARRKHRGNGSLIPRLDQLGDASAETESYEVDVISLDALGIERVDVWKIDAEGSEARVFRGARQTLARSRHCTAVVEFWPIFFQRANEDPGAFLDERAREGFRLARIDTARGRVVRARREEVLRRGAYELLFRR